MNTIRIVVSQVKDGKEVYGIYVNDTWRLFCSIPEIVINSLAEFTVDAPAQIMIENSNK